MNISDVAIRRPVFITMVVMAVVVLGLFAVMRLPIELFPKVDIPYVTVVTIYPGASPQEIETLITDKLEDELSAISDLKSMVSESQENFSLIAMEFKVEASLDAKAADVRDKVNSVKNILPDDAEDPIVYKLDLDSFPIMFFSVSSTRPPIEVRKTAEDIIKKRMEQIPGVATVAILGGREREIQIEVDRNRLVSKNLNILQVVEALRKDNLNVPVGKLKKGTEESLVRVIGEFATVEEIAAVEIPTPTGSVRIRDIADVRDSYKEINQHARLMGENAVSLSVQKQSGANTAAVSFAAAREIKELEKSLPDYNVRLVQDLSHFITDAVRDVRTSLMYGALFATIMIILFLRDGRSSMIIFLAIPTAIISTFMPIYSAGFSLNFMSLMGLAIAVGTLVDNSTVVLENIFRHLEMGKSPPDAARDGVREVGLAVIASGTTNICVYLPVAFMSGMVGQFFKEFGFTVAFATAFSIFIAFTLTPSLGARILKAKVDENGKEKSDPPRTLRKDKIEEREPVKANPAVVIPGLIVIGFVLYYGLGSWIPALNEKARAVSGGVAMLAVFGEIIVGVLLAIPAFKAVIFPAFDAGYAVIERNYPKVLAFSLRRRFVAISIVVVMFLASIALLASGRIGFEFVGQGDTGEFQVMVNMPPYASLDDTDAVVRRVEKMIEKIPELEVMSSAVGIKETETGTESSDPEYGYIKVKLVHFKKRKRSTDEVMQDLRTQVADIPDAIFQISQVSMGGPPGQMDLQIEVSGPDLDTLVEIADRVEEIVKATGGCIDVVNSWTIGKQEVHVQFNKKKLKELGLDVATVAMTVRAALEGDDSAKFREGGDEYDIRVRFKPEHRTKVDDVKDISIPTMVGPVKVSSIATITQRQGPSTISRKDGVRMIEVGGNLSGKSLGVAKTEIEKKIYGKRSGLGKNDGNKDKGIELPEGYNVNFGGQAEDMAEMMVQMLMAVVLAIMFVYMVMAAQFESFFHPFVVMFTLPLTFIGVVLALFITGKTLNMMSMTGVVMLIGIVVNNAIVYIDFVNQYRRQGMGRNEALLKAGPVRLRPILITSLTTICGMLPAAVLAGSGGGFRQPMAIAAVGGMIVSSMLTLIVIPTMYTIVDDAVNFAGRVLRRLAFWTKS